MARSLSVSLVALLASTAGALGFGWPFGDAERTLRLPGTVEAQEVRLGSKIGGRVAGVAVREGEVVEAGRPLVYLEAPEVEAQVRQARARLAAAEAELARAEHGPLVQEKEAARAEVAAAGARLDRLKAGSRPEAIAQARGELEAAEADLRNVSRDRIRVAALSNRGYATPTEDDEAHATVGRHLGRVHSARAGLDLLLAGSRAEEIAEAEAVLAKARANADLLEQGTREEDRAAARARVEEWKATLAERESDLRESVVLATGAAVVEVVAVRPGDLVLPNQPVARVLKDDDLWIRVYVPETELGHVRVGQKVEVTIDSHPGHEFPGTVSQVSSIGEFTPRNVQSVDERRHQVFGVKVVVEAPRGVFKSGMAAEVRLPRAEIATH